MHATHCTLQLLEQVHTRQASFALCAAQPGGCTHLISQAPGEDGDDNSAPQLGQAEEDAVRPVLPHLQQAVQARWYVRCQLQPRSAGQVPEGVGSVCRHIQGSLLCPSKQCA